MDRKFLYFLTTLNIWLVRSAYPPTGNPSLAEDLSLPCGRTTVSDEFFKFQWYLRGFQPYLTSMNVYKAWQNCFTGKNITIGIADAGVYTQNPDLNGQFIEGWKFDPKSHEQNDRSHGTKMAGVIAAKRNNGPGSYGVGVAYDAKLVDIRILTNHPSIENEAEGLKWKSNDIDIYACAFVHFPSGFETFKLAPSIANAIKDGATNGRQKKGSIYVWSTGNGGSSLIQDSCAYEGLCNNPYVIAVAGTDHNLRRLPGGERCSAMFVTALSRAADDRLATLITTSGKVGSTNNFGRNSAAVAIIAGAIALALEANPQLHRRDVLHLLVKSSRNDMDTDPRFSFDKETNDFESNGAGIRVSETFGFGVLDVERLVFNARNWRSVGSRIDCPFWYENIRLTNGNPQVDTSSCQINYIEHVEVDIQLYFSAAGQRNIYLVASQKGEPVTRSLLLPSRPLDNSNERNVTVVSVKFWGETAYNRKWHLHVEDANGQAVEDTSAFLSKWKLHIYGFKKQYYNSMFG